MTDDQERHLELVRENVAAYGNAPIATADGLSRSVQPAGSLSPACANLAESSVAVEAQSLVYGDREGDYGHPRENFTTTAQLWTVVLHGRLAEGEFITPEDVARCMRMVKEARQLHGGKRDNLVDIIGYAIAEDRLETGR